jgi:tRNA A-37 threonylcarbamoyl transferase component Bud32
MLSADTHLQNRYRIIRPLGQGGMGHVYEAVDENVALTVAIKERLAEVDSEKLKRAFEHEAKLLAGLKHRALPRVTNYFIEGHGQFLVMEYIGGENLAEVLKNRKGAIPFPEVMRWADSLLDALEYLHGQAIIHRDIKPENIKLTDEGKIYLLDFGLAKVEIDWMTSSVPWRTVAYAPLEQLNNAGTTNQSDLYSLGATLYHMLTGAPPPIASRRYEQVVEQDQADPLLPAHEVNLTVPRPLSDVVSGAMTIHKKTRVTSATHMRRALQEAARAIASEETRRQEQEQAEQLRQEREEAERQRREQERMAAAQRVAAIERQATDAADEMERRRAAGEIARQRAAAPEQQEVESAPKPPQEPLAVPAVPSPSASGQQSLEPPLTAILGFDPSINVEDLQAFIGKAYPYYFRKWEKMEQARRTGSINWAAFFAGVFWMVYRRMYFYPALLILFYLFQTAIEEGVNSAQTRSSPFNGIDFIIAIVICSRGNNIYRKHLNKKLLKIKSMGLDSTAERVLIEKKGGTSLLHALSSFVIFLALASVLILLINPPQNSSTSVPFTSTPAALDQTVEVNRLVAEYRMLVEQANQCAQQSDEISRRYVGKDMLKQRAEIERLAGEQVILLKQCASLFNEAGDKYEHASRLRVNSKFIEYALLKAQAAHKLALTIDAQREYAETLQAIRKTRPQAIKAKLSDVEARIKTMNKEITRLVEQSERLVKENPHDFDNTD